MFPAPLFVVRLMQYLKQVDSKANLKNFKHYLIHKF